MRAIVLVLALSTLVIVAGLGYSHLHKPSKRAYNPMALAPVEITNILYDSNIGGEALEPQLTYWVEGECPDCRILQAEAPLHINNATYLGFFNLTNNSLRLVPANESEVRKYIEFFREHGGKVFPCNSTATGWVGNSTTKVRGICVVPAIVKVGG
jgi:hypothetical protein